MQTGLTPWRRPAPSESARLAEQIEQAELAESLGFDSFWLPESHFVEHAIPAPLLILAAVAARTERIALGTTSVLLTVRPPLLVAEEAATVDQLSGGRLILGVGRGFRRRLFELFGVDRASKRETFERALEVIVTALEGRPLDDPAEGGSPALLSPRPVQQPRPPIWLAAFGPKALDQAGRLGFPYLASPVESLDQLADNLRLIEEARDRAGHGPLATRPVMRTVFVSDRSGELGTARSGLAAQARKMKLPHLRGSRDLDDWALVGEPVDVADRIAQLGESLGVTHLIARVDGPGLPPSALERSVECLAQLLAQR